MTLSADSSVQYQWPPQDPSRLPNPPPPVPSASAFVYGNNGFNPALKPSNANKLNQSRNVDVALENTSDIAEGASDHTGSSPERYLSDYDDDDEVVGPAEREAEMRRRMNTRVRRGGEGWEVRTGNWGVDLEDLEIRSGKPWDEEGRYRLYQPESEFNENINSDDDDDDWGD